MANLDDIRFTYDDLDVLWPLILDDDCPDITCAFYNGNFCKSLKQAQQDKHHWILEGINFKPGDRVLDIGCGWGPMLKAIKSSGGQGVGITLSPRQVQSCRRHGFEVYLQDWQTLDPTQSGPFDAIISLGAMEHFCSVERYLAGKQAEIYTTFFERCYQLLRGGGIFYLQTMVWGPLLPWGAKDPTAQEIDRYANIGAPTYSDAWVLGHVGALFPGSWLPKKEQIFQLADPYFELIAANDGRLDYIQTLTEWIKAWHAPRPGKTGALLKLLPNYLFGGRSYRAKLKAISENIVREVFIRQFFGHRRIFFKKKA